MRVSIGILLSAIGWSVSVHAHPEVSANSNETSLIPNCLAQETRQHPELDILDTEFSVRPLGATVIAGECAKFVRSHVTGHVYFYGGATAAIIEDGSLMRRPESRSLAKKSEYICDSKDDVLIYATLVSPGRLIGRKKDAKYVGVFKGADKWFIAAFETDKDGKIVRSIRFLESDEEIVAVGYFPHLHSGVGLLGVTIKGSKPDAVKLTSYSWNHRSF